MEIKTKCLSITLGDREIEFRLVKNVPNAEKLLRDFLGIFSINVINGKQISEQPLVAEQPEKKVMIAKLPTIRQRQVMLLRDMDKEEFQMQDYQDFMYKLGYDIKDVMYHDVRRLIGEKRLEEILVDGKSTLPKKYRVLRKDVEQEKELIQSLKEGQKVLMGTLL